MTLFNYRSALALFGLITTVALVPSTASAKGSVHLDLPGLSIGYHDNHYRHGRYHKRKHYRKRHHRRHHYRGHRDRHYYNRHRDYGYRDYGYSHRGYRYYDHGYYYKPRKRHYNRGNYCPTAGYSEYAYDNRNCYRHDGHFHCD